MVGKCCAMHSLIRHEKNVLENAASSSAAVLVILSIEDGSLQGDGVSLLMQLIRLSLSDFH
jgi:hypothetical protein